MAKILVVEDNALNIKLFCDLLTAHGHDAQPVTDSREALAAARSFAPDLIITDIQLPHLSGLELMQLVRADDELNDVPIMAVTAYAAQGDDERILLATEIILRRGIADLVLLGDPDRVRQLATSVGAEVDGVEIIDPVGADRSGLRAQLAGRYAELRAHRGMTLERARDVVTDVNYFGTLMVAEGLVDAAATSDLRGKLTADRPAELPVFDMGPPLDVILERCLEETGLPAPQAPTWA